jgi:hypothetical protein
MLSRRVFLLSAFTVPCLSLLQRMALASELAASKVLVLTEGICADTRAFARCLPASRIEADPGPMLLELDKSFRDGEFELVLGLSRDSNFMLVEQYAQANRYQLHYHGIHRYGAKGLSHTLHGTSQIIKHLETNIPTANQDWTEAISQLPGLSDYQDRPSLKTAFTSGHVCPKQSPGLLVSWLFKRSIS